MALIQVIINKDEGVQRYEDYMNIAFPSLALRKKEREDETKKVLKWWTNQGAMGITPLAPLTLKSKLKSRVAKVNQDEVVNKFYRGLDTIGK